MDLNESTGIWIILRAFTAFYIMGTSRFRILIDTPHLESHIVRYQLAFVYGIDCLDSSYI
jgi:hypothetical protein